MVAAGSKELLFSIWANFWAVEVSVAIGADMPVWAIAGAAGFWAGMTDVSAVNSAGVCWFLEGVTDTSSVSEAGSELAGFSANFNEFSGVFSAVNVAVCRRLS